VKITLHHKEETSQENDIEWQHARAWGQRNVKHCCYL